ncbi:MAG: YfiR family protein, partial [bacterium]|nr:YfiR family protein [bacterium]
MLRKMVGKMLGKDKCSRPFRRFLLLFPCLLIVLFGIGFSQQAFEEYKAKSAFIYKLCKFIQWPPSETNSPTSPLVISVMGKLPRGNKIEISSEKRIGERKIVIKSIKHLDEIGGSQVLFIAPSEARRVVDIIAWVNGKAILTIGDTKEFGA